jgi:hypothetical protein
MWGPQGGEREGSNSKNHRNAINPTSEDGDEGEGELEERPFSITELHAMSREEANISNLRDM